MIEKNVKASITMTYNLGNYESVKIGVELEVVLEDGETLEQVTQEAMNRIKAQVAETRKGMKR